MENGRNKVDDRTRPRGFVLIVTIGIIGVLGVLAATFSALSRVEREVSHTYVEKIRARLIAESGIERAIAQLTRRDFVRPWSDVEPGSWRYAEMFEEGLAAPAPKGYRKAVKAKGGAFTAGEPPKPLGEASEVSFKEGTLALAAKVVGFSGTLPGTYQKDGDTYSLKILDCASQIYVNDNQHNIGKILSTLGKLMGVNEPGFDLGVVLLEGAKARGRAYNNKFEILQVLSAKLGPQKGKQVFRKIRDFITCHAWVDPTTVWFDRTGEGPLSAAPDTSPQEALASLPAEGSAKAGAPVVPSGPPTLWKPPSAPPGKDDKDDKDDLDPGLPPDEGPGPGKIVGTQKIPGGEGHTEPPKWGGVQYYIEPRAPINVNTASKEVLMATLVGLKAEWQDYDTEAAKSVTKTAVISESEAETVAEWIIRHRYDFAAEIALKLGYDDRWSYNDWMHFFVGNDDEIGLDYLTKEGLTPEQVMLIKVNANPNTALKKFNPDLLLVNSNPDVLEVENRLKGIIRADKSDLVSSTTEWCWGSNGYYEVESIGRVVKDGEVVAEEWVSEVVKLYDVWRATSQEDLERDRMFEKLDGSTLFTDEGFPGIVTLPEYPYATSSPYYKSVSGNVEWASDYDGQILMGGIVQVPAGVTSGKRSFVAGFQKGTVGFEQDQHEGYHSTRHPEYSFTTPACDGSSVNGTPLYSHAQDTGYKSGWSWTQKKPHIVDPSSTYPGFFDNGMDLHPFGVYINYLKRQRFHTYWGDEVPAPEGTIEFFVKPEVDTGSWGSKTGNDLCRRMHFFDWGPPTWGSNYEVRVFSHGWRIYADFYHELSGMHHVMYKNVNDWFAHTWHHVELSWAPKGWKVPGVAAWTGEASPPPGYGQTDAATAIMYVDGRSADAISMGATYDGPHKDRLPGVTLELPEDIKPVGENNDIFGGTRLELGSKFQTYGGGMGMSQPSLVGTMDNLLMHHWRLHTQSSFPPKSRYLDPSYYVPGYVVPEVGSAQYSNCLGALYRRRLKFIERIGENTPVRLGTVSVSHFHQGHEHSGGHQANCYGHINVGLEARLGGAVWRRVPYDGGVGVDFPGWPAVGKGDQVYFVAEFERRDEIPLNHSPYIDDITVSITTGPAILYRSSEMLP